MDMELAIEMKLNLRGHPTPLHLRYNDADDGGLELIFGLGTRYERKLSMPLDLETALLELVNI